MSEIEKNIGMFAEGHDPEQNEHHRQIQMDTYHFFTSAAGQALLDTWAQQADVLVMKLISEPDSAAEREMMKAQAFVTRTFIATVMAAVGKVKSTLAEEESSDGRDQRDSDGRPFAGGDIRGRI